ncbi:MAG TPA: hypothetical protein VGC10_02925, partial [Sphingomonas sp.]
MTAIAPSAAPPPPASRARRGVAPALIALAAVPLLWPAIPPLTDLPAHMAEYHVAAAIGRSPALARYYGFDWALVGNLGVDLAVRPLVPLLGVEAATKLVVLLIPMLTVAGMLAIAREVHGRMPGSALFALPLAYAWPFQLGFVNFALAQALAFLAFALWLRLGARGRYRLRAGLFAPLACLLWVAHDFGWGLFGLLAFGAELARGRADGRSWPRAAGWSVLQCLPLALPLVAMLAMPTHPTGRRAADDWFNLTAKARWLLFVLRDRWPAFDALSLAPLAMMLYLGLRDRRLGMAPILAIPALLCLGAFVLLPRLLLGGAYVDMRIAPAMIAIGLLAIRPAKSAPRLGRAIALAGLAFLAVRTVATTASFVQRSGAQQRTLAALDHVPHGAAVLALVAMPCSAPGIDDRLDHLAALAIVRRDAFVNDQWAFAGQQLLRVRYAAAAPYLVDPSQLVFTGCTGPG